MVTMCFESINFEWDEHNEPKLWSRHQVSAEEAEEVFFNRNVMRSAGHLAHGHDKEERFCFCLFGRTDAGRQLFLVFVYKELVTSTPTVRSFPLGRW
ncbi:MAG: BrnT family toxin, partial [Armatimonadetes bacterium]|nr:BrnT family toxin [Armatimonadota bacterium]